jgi:multiple sugar transport system ATP-binding protein
MVYVTHDQVEAMTMGDRIVVMKDGLFQQIAEPLELYDNPCNKFVAALSVRRR